MYRLANLLNKLTGIFFGRGVPNLQKVGDDKTATPLFRQQKFYDPLIATPYPLKQGKIALKSVILNKINTLSVAIMWSWFYIDNYYFEWHQY